MQANDLPIMLALQLQTGFGCQLYTSPVYMLRSCRMRLRKKQWRNPAVIYTDEMVVGKDFQVFLNMEYFIEKLAGVSEYDASHNWYLSAESK